MLPRNIPVQLQLQHEFNLDGSDSEFKEFEELQTFLRLDVKGEEEGYVPFDNIKDS